MEKELHDLLLSHDGTTTHTGVIRDWLEEHDHPLLPFFHPDTRRSFLKNCRLNPHLSDRREFL